MVAHLESVDGNGGSVAVPAPAGVWWNAQASVLQVDAETALRTIGRAVAVAGLAVPHSLMALVALREGEVVACPCFI